MNIGKTTDLGGGKFQRSLFQHFGAHVSALRLRHVKMFHFAALLLFDFLILLFVDLIFRCNILLESSSTRLDITYSFQSFGCDYVPSILTDICLD